MPLNRKLASIAVTIITILALLTVSITILNYLGYAYPVEGRSMLPTIREGDLVFIVPASTKEVQVGQIIVYHRGEMCIIHRVIEKIVSDNLVLLKTKGDNNPVPDPVLVSDSMLNGVVVVHLPYFGFLAMSPYRYILAVLLGLCIIYELFYEGREERPVK